eukprot:15240913-Alexandrium_andersonii.AAC.1
MHAPSGTHAHHAHVRGEQCAHTRTHAHTHAHPGTHARTLLQCAAHESLHARNRQRETRRLGGSQ